MNQQYIQMRISSDENLSKELITILSSKTVDEFKNAIGYKLDYWEQVFRCLNGGDFSHLKKYENYIHTSSYSYLSLGNALCNICHFSNGNRAYGDEKTQEKKFKALLNSLSFLDCDIFLRLVSKCYDTELVDEYLNPPSDIEEVIQDEISEVIIDEVVKKPKIKRTKKEPDNVII